MVLEPPGLDPTTAPAAAIGEVTHYNIFEGLTKIDEDFSVTPLLAEKWTFSPDLKTLTFTLKPNVKFQDGEPFSSKDVKFSFERFAAKDSTNKEKAFFASIESIDTPDPITVVLKFKQPSFEALFHLGMKTAVIVDEKSARPTRPTRSAPDPTSFATGPRARRSHSTNGMGFASRRRSPSRTRRSASSTIRPRRSPPCWPATSTRSRVSANVQRRPIQSDPRFKVTTGGTEGKTILAMNNKKKPLDDSGSPGDRLRH